MSSVGQQLAGLQPLPTPPNHPQAPDPRPLWVVLIGMPGQRISIDEAPTQALLHWLRGLRLAAGLVELVTICAGSVLAGRHATTHHQHLDELQQVEPRCDVVAQPRVCGGCAGVPQAAEMAGFSSDTQLRRAWHQFAQRGTPSDPYAVL